MGPSGIAPGGIAGALFGAEVPPGPICAIIFDGSIVDELLEFAPAPPPGGLGGAILAMFGEFEPELPPEFGGSLLLAAI